MRSERDYLEVYFRDETPNLKVEFDSVGTVKIEKAFKNLRQGREGLALL